MPESGTFDKTCGYDLIDALKVYEISSNFYLWDKIALGSGWPPLSRSNISIDLLNCSLHRSMSISRLDSIWSRN